MIDPATATYASAPQGLRIGHIHLRVGYIARAENFYRGALGLDVTRRRTGATFLSSGGYHHHVAVNTWHSNHAGARYGERAGLGWFSMEINDQATLDGLKTRLGAAGVTTDAIPGGLCRDRPLGHPHPFHHCALNAARNVCADARRSPFGDQATLSGRFEGESRLEPKPPEWAAGSSRQVFSPEF